MYQDIWDAALGEQVSYKREPGNRKDLFVRALVTVGHMLKKISSLYTICFLVRGGTIYCQVVALRRYSRGLPEGGLEIPCMLTWCKRCSKGQ